MDSGYSLNVEPTEGLKRPDVECDRKRGPGCLYCKDGISMGCQGEDLGRTSLEALLEV